MSYTVSLIESAAGIWFASWAFRTKYETDYNLDATMRGVRWGVVLLSFGLANVPGPEARAVRLIGGAIGLAFLCWPNLAYHVVRVFSKHHRNSPAG
jgi:hypothetical protein